MHVDRLRSFAKGMTLPDRRTAQEAGNPAYSPVLQRLDTQIASERHSEYEDAREEAAVGGIPRPGYLREGTEEGGRVRAEAADTALEARIRHLAVGNRAAVDSLGRSRSGYRTLRPSQRISYIKRQFICIQNDGRG